jgi:putative transposase
VFRASRLLRPTVRRGQALREMLADHCSLYNGALQERREAWRHMSKTAVRYGDQSAQLKEIRTFDPERQGRCSAFPKRTRRRTKAHRAAARRVARLHAKIRRQRLDHHHKAALALVREHDVIGHERLNTAGMTKRPAPRPDPGQDGGFLANGAAAKAGLNKSILDSGWGIFLGILAQKAESAPRRVIPVDARNTSRTCPPSAGGCGHAAKENRVTQVKFECVNCGFVGNADRVGALNVLHRAGLALCDGAWPPIQEARDVSRGWSHADHCSSSVDMKSLDVEI